jgi:phage-related protein
MAGPLDRAYVEITAQLDTRQIQRTARQAGKAVEDELVDGVRRAENAASRGTGRIGAKAGQDFGDGFGSGLSATLSSIAGIRLPVAGFAVFGAGLTAAAGAAVQLAAALAPAVGIIAALPSGVGVLAAGMSTLSVATLGVGDAFAAAAGDEEEFNEAIEGLAPNVQAAAQAIRDLMPQLEELRNSVQDAFFQNFDSVLNQLADTLLGPVTTGMTAVASAINGVIQGLAVVATSAEGVDFVTQSFAIMAQIISSVQEPLALLFSSLLNVGTAINEAFGADAGAGLAGLITQFATFLDQAAASGQAVQWVTDALAVFSAIGDILSPLVGILGAIGSAAAASGGNILGVFGQVLQTFDDFLASVQGQTVLVTLFEALNTVGSAFATVLGNIAPALPPIISGIGNILDVVAPLLGPLSQLVGSVLTALAPVLTVVAAAIQPLIAPLSEIITLLGTVLVDAITALMPLIQVWADLLGGELGVVLELVATALGAIAPVISSLLEALAPLIEALSPLLEILGVVAEVIGVVLTPIIQVLGDILLWLVDTIINPVVIPILEFLVEVLSVALTAAVQFVVDKFQEAGQGLSIIFEFIKEQLTNRFEEMSAVMQFLVDAFRTGWNAINNNVFTPLKNGINAVKNANVTALNNIRDGFNSFVGFIKGIPGKISSSLSNLFAPLASGFRSAINSVISGWNNLSFSIPSVDIPGIGTVGGGTINTPNIPYLASGALATGPTLAMIGEGRFNEALLPLGDPRVDTLLASAMSRAGVQNQSRGDGSDSIAATGSSGDNYFVVRIGERELTDIVVEQQNAMNQQMLRRARSGTRRNH